MCVLKFASPAHNSIASSNRCLFFMRFSIRNIKNDFIFAKAFSMTTRNRERAVFFAFCLSDKGNPRGFLCGIWTEFVCTAFWMPTNPKSPWIRKPEKSNPANNFLKMVKSCRWPGKRLLRKDTSFRLVPMLKDFTVWNFFYHCSSTSVLLD